MVNKEVSLLLFQITYQILSSSVSSLRNPIDVVSLHTYLYEKVSLSCLSLFGRYYADAVDTPWKTFPTKTSFHAMRSLLGHA